jgi:hypothetical protein
MKQAHTRTVRGTVRALAGAAVCASLVATIGLVSSYAAEPAAAAAAPGEPAQMRGMHAAMGEHWSQHVQGHLDKLAERLEIKASQEAAWQKFSGAFRDTMRLHAMMGHEGTADGAHGADADAATLARQQADRAKEHAQKLAALADATAALRQSLGADQRLVFDEAARHFAREHGHGGMEALADGGHHGMMGEHCERSAWHGEGHGEHGDGHSHSEHGDDPHSSAMEPHGEPKEPAAPQGEAAH